MYALASADMYAAGFHTQNVTDSMEKIELARALAENAIGEKLYIIEVHQ